MAKMNVWSAAVTATLLSVTARAEMPTVQAQPEKGYVSGIALDSAGQPLGGVQIFVDGIGDNNVQITTKADGTYRTRVSFGAYRTTATMPREFDGQTFKVELKPDTTDSFDAEDGAIRNFTWVLTGKRPYPDLGTYGAFVYVNVGTDNFYVEDQDNITYTLTPVGKLIDGSEGQVIVRKGGAPRTDDYGKILDIPAGRYTITGVYAPPGKKPQTLRFKDNWARYGAFTEALEFGISAKGNFCDNCASVDVESPVEPVTE